MATGEVVSDVALRGVIDTGSLRLLQVDQYQREVLSKAAVNDLKPAVRSGRVPDISLGMRGYRGFDRDGNFYLQDPVYIIDGLQRVTAGLDMLASGEIAEVPHLGIKVHFNTTYEIERDMFEALNLGQTKLSSNVLLRNYHETIDAIDALWRLTASDKFVLKGQICWNQNMARSQRISAMTYCKVAAMLHSHAGPGRANNVRQVASGLGKIMDNVGRAVFTSNVRTFFDIVNRCWGIDRVVFRESAPFLRATFLLEMARVFSDHDNFWNGERLEVDPTTLKKLANFPIGDPLIVQLASTSGGPSAEVLYSMFLNCIKANRRSDWLKARRTLQDAFIEEDVDHDEAA